MIFELTTGIVFSSKTIFEIFDTFIFVCFLINSCTFIQHMTWKAKKKSCFGIHNIPLDREYKTIYRGPGFLADVWFGGLAPSPHPPPLPATSCLSLEIGKKARSSINISILSAFGPGCPNILRSG
jgi:hypothetical protein